MIYLKKHVEEDLEYVWADDYLEGRNEFDSNVQKTYAFLTIVAEYLNYFNTYSSTAYGNPDYERLKGRLEGYCMAMGWCIERTEDLFVITSGSRRKFVIEKPKIPQSEIENRREIRKTLKDIL